MIWNNEETIYLKKNYGYLDNKSLSQILNRTTKSIRSKAEREKLTGQKLKIQTLHPQWQGCGLLSKRHFNRIKNRAKRDKIFFNLTIEDCWNQYINQNGKCVFTGQLLSFSTTSRTYDGTASLDRIDSNKGYARHNIQWVHKDVNNLKGIFSNEYTIEMCHKISQHCK